LATSAVPPARRFAPVVPAEGRVVRRPGGLNRAYNLLFRQTTRSDDFLDGGVEPARYRHQTPRKTGGTEMIASMTGSIDREVTSCQQRTKASAHCGCGRADFRSHGVSHGRSRWRAAGSPVLGRATDVAVERNDPDGRADEPLPFATLAKAVCEPAQAAALGRNPAAVELPRPICSRRAPAVHWRRLPTGLRLLRQAWQHREGCLAGRARKIQWV
jgi:hypothetical protein